MRELKQLCEENERLKKRVVEVEAAAVEAANSHFYAGPINCYTKTAKIVLMMGYGNLERKEQTNDTLIRPRCTVSI
ncbi:MAG: hypothetical protein OXC42_03080 [Gammaproteobacteria bacterium]|nr:hypothetical protein [Gammaproteobacteria bacterium]